MNRHPTSSYNDQSHYIIEDIHNTDNGQYGSPSSIVTMPITHTTGTSYPLQSTTTNPISSTRQQELCMIQIKHIRDQPLTADAHCMRGICKPTVCCHANTRSNIEGQEVSHSDRPHVHHCCHGTPPCYGVSYCHSIHKQCDSDSEIYLKESARVEMLEKSNKDYQLMDKEQENCCNYGQSNSMYRASEDISEDSMSMTPSNNATTMADDLFIDELVSQVSYT